MTLDELVAAGLLVPSGVRGVYGHGGAFENVIEQFERYVTRAGRPFAPEVVRYPPLLPRAQYARLNHIHNFPDLLGSVHVFTGGDREHAELVRRFEGGEDWTSGLAPGEVMLIPAACYPLYPTATGAVPPEGRLVDLRAHVFRHEPSDDPARMQIFRQREFVRIGTAAQARAHRDEWLERGRAMLHAIGLPVEAVVADDPFFGRGGRLAKATQREQDLKYELVLRITSEKPTALSSCNCHLDYFGKAFDIVAGGEPAHTACIGFGLERIAIALFATHGTGTWPRSVRATLELD